MGDGRNVLQHDVAGSKLANHPERFLPKPALSSFCDTSPPARLADVRAWEAGRDDVNGGEAVRPDRPDVAEPLRFGEVLREDFLAPFVNFHLPYGTDFRSLKPEFEAADAGEERAQQRHSRLLERRKRSHSLPSVLCHIRGLRHGRVSLRPW